jgi:hypothetical protein
MGVHKSILAALVNYQPFPTMRDLSGNGSQAFADCLFVVEIESHDPLFLIYRRSGAFKQKSRGFDPTGLAASAAYTGGSKQAVWTRIVS